MGDAIADDAIRAHRKCILIPYADKTNTILTPRHGAKLIKIKPTTTTTKPSVSVATKRKVAIYV